MKKVFINKARGFKEADEFDRKFWQRAGAQKRFITAWSMVIDYLKAKGKNASQQRLRRSVQNIKRLQD